MESSGFSREKNYNELAPFGNVEIIDNTSTKDNWIINRCDFPVTVACSQYGIFSIDLEPGESARITYDVEAKPFPFRKHSFGVDFPYKLGKGERWEIFIQNNKLSMGKEGTANRIALEKAFFSTPQIEPFRETLTDIDGNVYHTIKIGNQIWTVENFKATRFNDGEDIPYVKKALSNKYFGVFKFKVKWGRLKTPAYCWYDNDIRNKNKYGALYNWYAVATGKLAPKGWHIPTATEWIVLEKYLVSNGYNWDGNKKENMVAKALASKTDWKTVAGNYNTGSIGKDLAKNNLSGFSAFPGGYRSKKGQFEKKGECGYWWRVTVCNKKYAQYDLPNDWCSSLNCLSKSLERDEICKSFGISVRLVRD